MICTRQKMTSDVPQIEKCAFVFISLPAECLYIARSRRMLFGELDVEMFDHEISLLSGKVICCS